MLQPVKQVTIEVHFVRWNKTVQLLSRATYMSEQQLLWQTRRVSLSGSFWLVTNRV